MLLELIAAGSSGTLMADYGQWLVALVAAVVGAVLALGGEFAIRQRALQSQFSNLKQLMIEEVIFIRHEADARSRPSAGLPLSAPLPTSAWDLLRASGEAQRLKGGLKPSLEFYREVSEVNWTTGAVLTLQQISSLSPKEEVASQFFQEAMRLATEPYGRLVGRADALLTSLEASKDADATSRP